MTHFSFYKDIELCEEGDQTSSHTIIHTHNKQDNDKQQSSNDSHNQDDNENLEDLMAKLKNL